MANQKILGSGNTIAAKGAGTTNNFLITGCIQNGNIADNTETSNKLEFNFNGTVYNLAVRVIANGTNASSTQSIRKNEGAANGTVTIPLSTTGWFTDLVNVDAFVSGDFLGDQLIVGTGGTLTVNAFNAACKSNSGNVTIMCSTGGANSPNDDKYFPVGNESSPATSDFGNLPVKEATTISFLTHRITLNNLSTATTTFRSRKNQANGNQVITVLAGVSGLVKDSSNSDSLAVDDNFSGRGTTAAGGSGSCQSYSYTMHLTSASSTTIILAFSDNGSSLPTGTTRYTNLVNRDPVTTEICEINIFRTVSCTVTNLFGRYRTVGSTNDSTITFRKDLATSGNLTYVLPASTTGLYYDTANSDTVGNNAFIAIIYVLGSGSGNDVETDAGVSMALNDGGGSRSYATVV